MLQHSIASCHCEVSLSSSYGTDSVSWYTSSLYDSPIIVAIFIIDGFLKTWILIDLKYMFIYSLSFWLLPQRTSHGGLRFLVIQCFKWHILVLSFSILPDINSVMVANYNVSQVHSHEDRLDRDYFRVDRRTNCIA